MAMEEEELLMVDSSSSGYEETGEPTRSGARRPLVGRGLGVLAAVVGLVGAVALMASEAPAHKTFRPRQVGGLRSLIQAYAIQREGRELSEGELSALFAHGQSGKFPCDMASLQKFTTSSKEDKKEAAVEMGLSDACSEAISQKLEDIVTEFVKLLVDSFFNCALFDPEGDQCQDVVEKLGKFPDIITEECKASGEFCDLNVSEVVNGKVVSEELQSLCVPSACHDEAKHAVKLMQDEMAEVMAAGTHGGHSSMDSDCPNCTITIKCG